MDSVTVPCGLHLSYANCPRGSFVVGEFLFLPHIDRYDICITPTTDDVNETVGCATPTVGEVHAWIGYTTRAKPEPCASFLEFFDTCRPTVAVATSSWAKVKALYRD